MMSWSTSTEESHCVRFWEVWDWLLLSRPCSLACHWGTTCQHGGLREREFRV